MMRNIIISILLLICFAQTKQAQTNYAEKLRETMQTLDEKLKQRDFFKNQKEQRIEALKFILHNENISADEMLSINSQISDEYISFQFDSACHYINCNIALATKLKAQHTLQSSYIALADLYATTGFYLEASEILQSKIDTLQLHNNQLVKYFIASEKLHNELAQYSVDTQHKTTSLIKREALLNRIIKSTETGSKLHNQYVMLQLIHNRNEQQAYKYAMRIISEHKPHEHGYAIAAFLLAMISQEMGDTTQKLYWLAQAAIVDTELAVKDNVALSLLARDLQTVENNLGKRMQYMRYAMDDALFFNSRLRPGQLSETLAEIERAYNIEKNNTSKLYRLVIALVLAFALVMLVFVIFINKQRKRLSIAQQKLKSANKELSSANNNLQTTNGELLELNKRISESDRVKLEYIGNFLLICSEHIERIDQNQRHVKKMLRAGKIEELKREYDNNELLEKETHKFYHLFDTIFINLYPTFIEEFNSLLEPDAHLLPRKGEILSTELRIFAIIRLGITDSSKISTLLRYSMSTIYNYRSKVKNRAKVSKDEFDERVKTIGAVDKEN